MGAPISKGTNTNLFKTCNFAIQLPGDQSSIEFFVQEASLPGIQLGEMQISHMSQIEYRPGDNISWNPLTLTVVCDETLQAFKQAYDFVIKTKNPETAHMDNVDQPFEAYMHLTSNKNNIIHTIVFHDAWIQNITDLQLMNTSMEDEQVTFTLDLRYSWYEFMR